jgi:phage tail-like protein
MGVRTDPLVGFHFGLDIQGVVTGYFSEVGGLGSEHDVIENKVMEANGSTERVMKIPGRLKWENITLKRGITSAMDIWTWRQTIIDGQVESNRKNGSVFMYDEKFTLTAQWDFVRGWPSKVTGPAPKADSNEIGVEELTITHEGIKRTK